MTKVKEYTYDKNTSWQGYIDYVRENMGRELSEADYKSMMGAYIKKISAEEWIEENK